MDVIICNLQKINKLDNFPLNDAQYSHLHAFIQRASTAHTTCIPELYILTNYYVPTCLDLKNELLQLFYMQKRFKFELITSLQAKMLLGCNIKNVFSISSN